MTYKTRKYANRRLNSSLRFELNMYILNLFLSTLPNYEDTVNEFTKNEEHALE